MREIVLVARDDGNVGATIREQEGKAETEPTGTTRNIAVLTVVSRR